MNKNSPFVLGRRSFLATKPIQLSRLYPAQRIFSRQVPLPGKWFIDKVTKTEWWGRRKSLWKLEIIILNGNLWLTRRIYCIKLKALRTKMRGLDTYVPNNNNRHHLEYYYLKLNIIMNLHCFKYSWYVFKVISGIVLQYCLFWTCWLLSKKCGFVKFCGITSMNL